MLSTLGIALVLTSGVAELRSVPAPCSIEDAVSAEQTVWLLCDDRRVMASRDRGASWVPKALPEAAKYRTVALLDGGRGFVAGDQGTLLMTEDGGETWRQVAVETSENLTALHFAGDRGWLAGWGGVIFESTDGGHTWTRRDSGVSQSLESIFFADERHGWAVGWLGTILRTADGGQTWARPSTAETIWSLHSVYFSDLKNGWAVGFQGQLLRTRDGGATWTALQTPVSSSLGSILFDRGGRGWIAAENTLLVSDDQGETWRAMDAGLTLFLRRMLEVDGEIWAVGRFGIVKPVEVGEAPTTISRSE